MVYVNIVSITKLISAVFICYFLSCSTVTPGAKSGKNTGTTSDRKTGATSLDSYIADILKSTNRERQQRNVQPLKKDDRLMAAAGDYALLMAKEDKLSHNIGGQRLENRIARVQYRWKNVGENIALNTSLRGEEIVIEQWMKSPGHRSNILDKTFTEIGIGIGGPSKTNKFYYCQIFARP